jgi:hypothetical protein
VLSNPVQQLSPVGVRRLGERYGDSGLVLRAPSHGLGTASAGSLGQWATAHCTLCYPSSQLLELLSWSTSDSPSLYHLSWLSAT